MADINELREKISGLSSEQLEQIAGGTCSINEWMKAAEDLAKTYENLIDFTSYMIERVAGQ